MTNLPPAPGTPGQPALGDAEVRQWASFAHLGGILGFLPSLIIWLVKKDQSAFVAQEAKAALNFQITLLIAYVAVQILDSLFLPFGIAGLLQFAVWVSSIIFSVMGFQAVNRGQSYSYPFSLTLVK